MAFPTMQIISFFNFQRRLPTPTPTTGHVHTHTHTATDRRPPTAYLPTHPSYLAFIQLIPSLSDLPYLARIPLSPVSPTLSSHLSRPPRKSTAFLYYDHPLPPTNPRTQAGLVRNLKSPGALLHFHLLAVYLPLALSVFSGFDYIRTVTVIIPHIPAPAADHSSIIPRVK
ncbi:unnamed protein product [Cyclocybe aegerita]|uniref:Uncharacterized protein n=1 Tax=Cyclocybe aegerita TaxID=1973307 RepID=A0A8S0XWP7_CYCAE|nr:unnamed protein product [Cyclocybe aegerita]